MSNDRIDKSGGEGNGFGFGFGLDDIVTCVNNVHLPDFEEWKDGGNKPIGAIFWNWVEFYKSVKLRMRYYY